MRRLLASFVLSVLSSLCHAQAYLDLSFPNGLTLSMYGGSNYPCPECGLDQGAFMVRFNENLNQSWYSNCLNQRFYINANSGGKAVYQALQLAQLTGRKITRILATPPNPNAYNTCLLHWVQVE